MYEVIDEKLNLFACNIADLTVGQINCMLKLFGDNSAIGTLTLFYDRDCGRIVLNKDHAKYEFYLDLCREYLVADEDARAKVYEKCESKEIIEALSVLNDAIGDIKVKKIMDMLKMQQSIPDGYGIGIRLVKELEKLDDFFSIARAYKYGIIQGKRMERARRKK